MRIGMNVPDPQGISPEQTSVSSSAQKASRASDHDSDSFSSDTVSLSSLASLALQTPEVRQDTVDRLRQQVSSGTYQLAPQSIAEAMLGH